MLEWVLTEGVCSGVLKTHIRGERRGGGRARTIFILRREVLIADALVEDLCMCVCVWRRWVGRIFYDLLCLSLFYLKSKLGLYETKLIGNLQS